MMSKFGNILFHIQPQLSHDTDYINYDSCWTFGLDVSHNRGKPSVELEKVCKQKNLSQPIRQTKKSICHLKIPAVMQF
jgi:hypothetical protein